MGTEGVECSIEEKEIRYRAFHDALYSIENEIKHELNNKDITKKKYSKFFLISQSICKKYPSLLNYPFNPDKSKNQIFDFKDLTEKTEQRDCSYLEKDLIFDVPSDFIFINKDFMESIHQFHGKIKDINIDYETIIGGDCLIIKSNGGLSHLNIFDNKPLRFIVLYNEIKDNIGNEVNFLLYIKDRDTRKIAVNYILEHNLWKYFEKINYTIYKDYQKIYDEKGETIGYLIRTSNLERIKPFFQKFKKKLEKPVYSHLAIFPFGNFPFGIPIWQFPFGNFPFGNFPFGNFLFNKILKFK